MNHPTTAEDQARVECRSIADMPQGEVEIGWRNDYVYISNIEGRNLAWTPKNARLVAWHLMSAADSVEEALAKAVAR